MSASEVF